MRRRGRGFGRSRIIVHRTAALLALALGRMLLRCGFRRWLQCRCWFRVGCRLRIGRGLWLRCRFRIWLWLRFWFRFWFRHRLRLGRAFSGGCGLRWLRWLWRVGGGVAPAIGHRPRGVWRICALFHRWWAGILLGLCWLGAFLRQRTIADAFAPGFELVVTGFNGIIAVPARAGDGVIGVIDDFRTNGGDDGNNELGQRVSGSHHGQDIEQWDDRRDQLGQCGIGGIDDIGNSARALLGRVRKLLAFIAVDIKVFLNAGQVLAQGSMGNLRVIRAQEIRKPLPAAVREISSHRGDGMAQYVLWGDAIYRADELT